MNEIIRFSSKPAGQFRLFRQAATVILSCLVLALCACQSSRSISDRMESKYSLKKRKTSISCIRSQAPEQCDLPVKVPENAYRGLVESVEKSKGIPYRFGGNTPQGFDCSGFVQYLFNDAFRFMLPRTSTDLALLGKIIPREKLRPGDLLFFSSGNDIDHVGVYLGDGRFAHASSSVGISISSLRQRWFDARYAFATRIIEVR